MHNQYRPPSGINWVMAGLLGLGMLFLCLLLGLMAAVVPVGTLARLLALPGAIMLAIVMWMLPKRRQAPDGLLQLALVALVLSINLWPGYVVYRIGGLPSVNPTKLAWLGFLLLAAASVMSCEEPLARLTRRCKAHPWIIFSVLFLMLWRAVSAAAGEQPISQVLSLASEIVTYYVLFFAALAVLRDERDVVRLLTVLMAAAILQALLASYESVAKHTLFDRFVSVGSDDSAAVLDMLREKFRDGHYRAQGTFEHPMVLAEFMAMIAPLAVIPFFSQKTGLWRWICVAFLPFAFGVILSSRSRVGIAVLMTAVLLAGCLLLLPRGDRARHSGASLSLALSIFLLPVLLVAGYFAMQEVSHLIAGRSAGEASSTMSRVLMMQRGIPLLRASPFFGYGNGMGAVKLGFFDGVRFNIDNYWLGVALDAGVPGLVAFAAVFGLAALLGLKYYRQRDDNAGLAAGFMAISIVIMLGCKTVLSIASGFTLAYVLIAAIIVLGETPVAAAPATGGLLPAERGR